MIIIPARLKSSRFENKILAEIDGLPMVIRTAKRVEGLDDICIATDSEEVLELAETHNIKAVLTSTEHNSGTDRIKEAAEILNLPNDEIIINVQADEPYIEREVVTKLLNEAKKFNNFENGFFMISVFKKITSEAAEDPNHVKVILNEFNEGIYFSRAKIPFNRDKKTETDYSGHLGLYAFTTNSLFDFCSLEPSVLEETEKLEQLRAISNKRTINMVEVESKSFGIDTAEDLEHLNNLIITGQIK